MIMTVRSRSRKNLGNVVIKPVTQPATIDPAEFTFTPPPGTNIVR